LWRLRHDTTDLADDFYLPGYALQYLRYAAAGIIYIFLAPLILTKLGLAKANAVQIA
jgi:hypothetical protein